ncbi:hypothetical protein V5799_017328 [Amblyomma americanum]|uniref:Uncharacterized protein n=1 Tax=Amblyomma americanum TaxID=6943 RepID=A0AAQ4F319_AMBAM
MFNSCMTQTDSQVGVLKNFMREHGLVWPEDPTDKLGPAEVLFDLAFNWNVNLWFSLKLLPSTADDHEKRRIFLAPNDLMLQWRNIFRQIPEVYFKTAYSNLFRLFNNDINIFPSTGRIQKDYDMLKNVFDVLLRPQSRKNRVPAVMPLRDLGSHTEATNAQYITDAMNAKLRIEPPLTMDDLVLVSDMALLKAVFEIFGSAEDDAVRRHLALLFLQAYAAVADPAAALLVLLGNKQRAQQQRPFFCASQGAVEVTQGALWLDNETRQVAVEKLRDVRTVLWPADKFLTAQELEAAYANFTETASSFAEFWIKTRRSLRGLVGSDVGLQELRIRDSTAHPYVLYIHVLNELSLSVGALAPPLYYKDGTKAMLYGGLGYCYAKQLLGALDSEGVKSPENWTAVLKNVFAVGRELTFRAIKDRTELLVGYFRQEDRANLRKSATEEQYTERDQLLQEISDIARDGGYMLRTVPRKAQFHARSEKEAAHWQE